MRGRTSESTPLIKSGEATTAVFSTAVFFKSNKATPDQPHFDLKNVADTDVIIQVAERDHQPETGTDEIIQIDEKDYLAETAEWASIALSMVLSELSQRDLLSLRMTSGSTNDYVSYLRRNRLEETAEWAKDVLNLILSELCLVDLLLLCMTSKSTEAYVSKILRGGTVGEINLVVERIKTASDKNNADLAQLKPAFEEAKDTADALETDDEETDTHSTSESDTEVNLPGSIIDIARETGLLTYLNMAYRISNGEIEVVKQEFQASWYIALCKIYTARCAFTMGSTGFVLGAMGIGDYYYVKSLSHSQGRVIDVLSADLMGHVSIAFMGISSLTLFAHNILNIKYPEVNKKKLNEFYSNYFQCKNDCQNYTLELFSKIRKLEEKKHHGHQTGNCLPWFKSMTN